MKRFPRFFLFLAVFIVATGSLSAEGPMAGVFAAADKTATDIPRILPDEGDLLLGGITHNQLQVKLGDLFADLAANRLSGRNDFGAGIVKQYASPMYPPAQASWILSGNLYDAGAGYLLIVQLTDTADESQIRGWEFALREDDVKDLLIPSLMASAGSWDPMEPNDEYAAASMIQVPFYQEGLRLADGDEDWFLIEVPPSDGDTVIILEAATGGVMDTYMELYAPNDQSWPIAEDDDTDGGNAVLQMPLTMAGTWYLKVRAYSSEEEGEYSLTVNLSEGSLGPGEPDEGPEQANRLNVGQRPIAKRIDYSNDEDWFRIDLVRPLGRDEVLRIETMGYSDLMMELMDEYQGYIMDDDDSGEGNNAMIMVAGLDAGTYYAVVSGYGGEQAEYEIMANIAVPVRDEYEDDGSMYDASRIQIDALPQRRNFSPVGDVDWVSFEISRSGDYFMYTAGEIDTYMELYDSDGNLIIENDDAEDYNAAIERRLAPGEYFLMVSPYGTASPDDVYELSVESLD